MIFNYLKLAFRNILRQRGYSLINIVGLSIGLTVSLLILLWVQDEMNVDKFHRDGDRIYRLLTNISSGNNDIQTWENTPYPIVEYLSDTYPEIESIGAYDPTNKKQFKIGDKEYLEDGMFATAGFFDVLSFPFIEKESEQIFVDPNSIVITRALAAKLFGEEWRGNAIGEVVDVNGYEYKVSAVIADPPEHSSIDFEFVLDLEEQHRDTGNSFPWGTYDSRVLFKLNDLAAPSAMRQKIRDAIQTNNKAGNDAMVLMQSFEGAYLFDHFENGKAVGGRIAYVRLFSLAAFFLLIIACINFMNLATARASRRAKEVGVRKTIGAGRTELIVQFMTEACIITFISVGLAVLFSEFSLGYFLEISGKDLNLNYGDPNLWLLIGGVSLTTAVLAGSYPAFFLSSFKITNVLKGELKSNLSGSRSRHGLVVFQFILSVMLLVGALVVDKQVSYIRTKHLGINKDNVLYFRTPPGVDDNHQSFKEELLRIPGINDLTFASTNPLSVGSQTGDPVWEGMSPGDELLFNTMLTDHNFAHMMDLEIVEGRDFSPLLSTDTFNFLINQTAGHAMKLENPVGKRLEFWGVSGRIIGVVKDFHISSLHESIGPLILANVPSETRLTMMRIDPARTEQVIAATNSLFNKHSEGYPFRYDFLDDRYMQMYRGEQRMGDLSRWFAIVALIISCLGLLGLTAFVTEQRNKEIGIRKVLGATVLDIVGMLSLGFIKLVGISLIVALPLSWYFMNDWLTAFAYRIDLSIGVFVAAGVLAVGITLLTVGFLSMRAAMNNPVNSLKSE